jgi:Fe-S-cluster containining protein
MSSELCQQCGACCATYRVAFAADETDSDPGGRVPAGLTEPFDRYLVCMRGTAGEPVRCAALGGKVGDAVKCNIYEWRPGPCHELLAGGDGCNRARIRWGLPRID